MALMETITSYNVRVEQSNLTAATREIQLKLEFGSTVSIFFAPSRPANWLSFPGPSQIEFWMAEDQFVDVHRVLQTEDPVFCTALDLFGLQVGAVHTELDLSLGEPTGEGYRDGSLEALIVRARQAGGSSA
ncbi:MAG TPA: hypothetical protein VHO01_10990 [Jatrophihabitans sp.]|nr:hypothetical protein [Jatrophihabitans sp.]